MRDPEVKTSKGKRQKARSRQRSFPPFDFCPLLTFGVHAERFGYPPEEFLHGATVWLRRCGRSDPTAAP